jgi:hypothetical protein
MTDFCQKNIRAVKPLAQAVSVVHSSYQSFANGRLY